VAEKQDYGAVFLYGITEDYSSASILKFC